MIVLKPYQDLVLDSLRVFFRQGVIVRTPECAPCRRIAS